MQHTLDRRRLLYSAASTALAGAILACQKSPPATCPAGALTPDEINVRTTLGYTDHTPEPGKPCVKCTQYVPAPSADQCGTCKIMKGPIHPKGYCRAFAPL
ncbi:MAG TPA: hypothetical protein VGK73_26715 [Polyangiaceae bacterium]